ncbi:TonB-dependent receptor [Labilibaculum sp. DW002]|uniref:TonB-dependent receptor n=1 Tax=Paralabilibaculum antarcticum TaxID=2912572 RepID=A0ABT5VXT7_9BACT|nr:TonB-dependent receptor [Labilibaculum sp. DW002]MDE5420229.1 TonB-dependent receptor [Labilibaculum sp. DW002]
MKKLCAIVYLLFVVSISLFSMPNNYRGVVKGMVVNQSSKDPLPFVTVSIPNSTNGTLTDDSGAFLLGNLKPGKHELQFSCVGFKPMRKQFEIQENVPVNLQVSLSEDVIGLAQIVVSADRSQVSRKEAPVIVNMLSAKSLQQVNSCSLAEGLAFAPGIRVENNCNNCGFNQVRMNGMEGNYSQILINSRQVISGLASVYGLEHIPTSMIQRIEIVRGGGSALFGSNAIAGTINVITKDPISNNFSLNIQNNILGVGLNDKANDFNIDFNSSIISDDRKTGMFLFGVKREREAWDATNDGFSNLVEIKSKGAGMQAYHRFSDRSKLSAEYHFINEYRRGGDHLNRLPFNSEIAEQVEHDIHAGGLTWDLYLDKERKHKLSTFVSGQYTDRETYYGTQMFEDADGNPYTVPRPDYSAFGSTKDIASVIGTQYATDLDKFLMAPAKIVLGIENTYNTLKDKKLGYFDPIKNLMLENTVISDQRYNTFGSYAQVKWDLNFMNLLVGGRFDSYRIKNDADHSVFSNSVFCPRVNLQFKLSENINVRTSYARGYRAPQIFDEDLHIEASTARTITHELDENLKEETSNTYLLSAEWDFTMNKWESYFLVEGFYNRLNNPFYNDYIPNPDNSQDLIALRTNAGGSDVAGVNFEYKLVPSHVVNCQLGFTLQNGKYDTALNQGENTFTDKVLRSPNQYGYLLVNLNPSHHTELSINGTYTGPMHMVHLGGGLDKNGMLIEESLVKTNSFYDLGFKFAYHIDFGDQMKIEFNAGVKNLFNSFQDDPDYGNSRDATYVYGPISPRTIFFGISLGNVL